MLNHPNANAPTLPVTSSSTTNPPVNECSAAQVDELNEPQPMYPVKNVQRMPKQPARAR